MIDETAPVDIPFYFIPKKGTNIDFLGRGLSSAHRRHIRRCARMMKHLERYGGKV